MTLVWVIPTSKQNRDIQRLAQGHIANVVVIKAERAAEVCVFSQCAAPDLDTNHRRGKKKKKAKHLGPKGKYTACCMAWTFLFWKFK